MATPKPHSCVVLWTHALNVSNCYQRSVAQGLAEQNTAVNKGRSFFCVKKGFSAVACEVQGRIHVQHFSQRHSREVAHLAGEGGAARPFHAAAHSGRMQATDTKKRYTDTRPQP